MVARSPWTRGRDREPQYRSGCPLHREAAELAYFPQGFVQSAVPVETACFGTFLTTFSLAENRQRSLSFANSVVSDDGAKDCPAGRELVM
jgi:hypothetical protein